MQKQIKIAQLIAFMLIVILIAMGTASAADSLSDNSVTCVNHAPNTYHVQKKSNVPEKTKNLSIDKTESSNIPLNIQIWKDGVPISLGGQPAGYNWGTIQNVNDTVPESQYTPKLVKSKTTTLKTYKSAEVTMTKTSNGPVHVGEKGTFTITLTNKGPYKAKNVIVRDPFIKDFIYTPSTGTYNPKTGLWTIGTLENGRTATLNISKMMRQSDLGRKIYNTASETQITYNPRPITPQTATLIVNPTAHVIMTKTSNGPVNIGQNGTFTITLTNYGPNDATHVIVIDPYIRGFTYEPSTGSYNFFAGLWIISKLANGGTATLTISKIMSPTDVGTIRNTASETQITYNPTPITPQTATLIVNPVAHVIMTKTSNGPVYVGQNGTFTITLTNNGPNDAANVLVNDPFISGFTYSSSVGTYDSEKGVWNVGTLANGATVTLTMTKVLSASDVGLIMNTASETQETYNPTPITPKVASITVRPVAHVVLSNISNGPVYAGQIGMFTVTVTNNGPNDAIRVVVIDRFINGFTYTPSIGTYNPSKGIWGIEILESGETATLTITRIMQRSDVGTRIYNTVHENQQTYNPYPVTRQVAVLSINPVARVIMTKSGNGPVYVGHRGTFTITLMNKGPDDAAYVQVRDPFIRGFTYKPSVGLYDTETGIWTISSLVNGQTATLIMTKIMSATDVGTIHNTASETQITYNPSPIKPQTATIIVNPTAHVIMTITSNGPVNIGQKGTFTITLTNKGPNDVQNVHVTDVLPSGFTMGSISMGIYDENVWTIPLLANCASATLTFNRVMTNADGGTTKTNTASETQETFNPVPVTPKTATIYVYNMVLSINKTSDKRKYNAGDSVIYIIHVKNIGPDTATNIIVTDTLRSGLTYVGSTLGGSYNPLTRTITWNLASLKSGKLFNPTFTATVNSCTQGRTISNTASAYNNEIKTPVTSTPVNIKVNKAVLSIKTSTDKIKYNTGDLVIYNISVKNNGPDTATNIIVKDKLPTKMTFVSSTLVGNYNALTRTITWTLVSLDSGKHFNPSFRATVNSGTQGRTISNTASAYNNEIKTPVTSTPVNIKVNNAVLSIKTISDKRKYNAGNTAVYIIQVKNNGPDTATNIIVTDKLQSGLTYVVSTLGGSYNPLTRTITWNLTSLKSGKLFNPAFTVKVNNGTQGQTITNTASAYNNEIITPKTSAPVNIKVNKAVLSIKTSTNKRKCNVGDSVVYNIVVKNNGPDTATKLMVTDSLPLGMIFVSSTMGGVWNSRARTVTWSLNNLRSGAQFIANLTAGIKASRGKTLINRAQAKDDQIKNPVSTTITIHVKKSGIYLKVVPTHVNTRVGKPFTITYKVGNKGPDEAYKVVMTFVIPDGLKVMSVITQDSAKISYIAGKKTLKWILGDEKVGKSTLKLNLKALKAGTFIVSSKLKSSTISSQQVIVSAVTVKARKKVNPHRKKVHPNKRTVHHHKTVYKHPVSITKTGTPIGALILGILMILGGLILPKMKN